MWQNTLTYGTKNDKEKNEIRRNIFCIKKRKHTKEDIPPFLFPAGEK